MLDKRGQVSIFVIIAIIIVAAILGYFLLRGRITLKEIPAEFRPIENYFLSCIEDNTKSGIEILNAQGGYIKPEKFEPGSIQSPFSSQLDFLGIGIPYWYYVSGNNLIREQVPSKKEMENQLANFVGDGLEFCDFSAFREKGFSVEKGEAKVSVILKDNSIDVSVDMPLIMNFSDKTARKDMHKTNIKTNLFSLYKDALNIYNKEKTEAFLENYGLDVLRLYAPVDGIILDCSPKIWNLNKISDELKNSLQANIETIRNGEEKSYFVRDFNVNNEVRFLYSKNFPYRIEVWPSESGLMIAQPIGLQAGLGALGFCYVPYHFVYDFYFPVLVQVYDNNEIFQFPLAVIIDKNMPKNSLQANIELAGEPEICSKANTPIKVYTYDSSLEPVEASVSLKCLDETCIIGETKRIEDESYLEADVPQCGNAIIYAEAEDYISEKEIVSTNEFKEVNILLNKKYEDDVVVLLDGKETSELAIVNFISEKDSASLAWPEQKKIKLSEGDYDVFVYVYKNASINLPESTKRQCIDVARKGILGVFGMTEEKCFEMTQPSVTVNNALAGGGKSKQYITEYELKKGKLEIRVESLPVPKSIEDLQKNYDLFEDKNVYAEFV